MAGGGESKDTCIREASPTQNQSHVEKGVYNKKKFI